MPKRSKINIKTTAVAKIEASVRASFERKKSIKEIIPPEVTRAKAGAWLDLISPITEWAGLKGDALRFQRQQLRIQQEESLLVLAQAVCRKIAGKEVANVVPRKILVPALERASLEEAQDETMIDLWANLLASSSMGLKVEPRYVGIIGELSGSQAKSLYALAFNRSAEANAPYSCFMHGRWEVDERQVESEIRRVIEDCLGEAIHPEVEIDKRKLPELELEFSRWANNFGGPSIYLEYFSFWNFEYNTKIGEGLDISEKDFGILESLGLIKRLKINASYEAANEDLSCFGAYCHLTVLGVDFVSICAPDMVSALEAREVAQRERA